MRILIATITAGGGHLQAAAALDEAWRAMRPRDVVEKVDLQKFFSPLHKTVHTAGYVKLVEHAPEVWGMLFKLRRTIRNWCGGWRSGGRRFRRGAYDAVHPLPEKIQAGRGRSGDGHYLPVEILGKAREEFKGKSATGGLHRDGF